MKTVLLGLITLTLFLSGCDSKPKEEDKKTSTVEKVQEKVAEQVEKTSDKTQQLSEKVDEKVKEVSQTLQDGTQEVIDESEAPIEEVKDALKTTKQKVTQAVSTQTTGKDLFVPCISCHGANGQRKALNASQVIAGWSEEKIINALQGYKDGTYGGTMKASMVGQVARLSDEDIKKLAKYISTL